MRILVVTNLFPNPYQPHRAPWNYQQLQRLSRDHEMHVIAPILWTDEWRARRRVGPRLPTSRRIQWEGGEIDHPRYLYTPKMMRSLSGQFYKRSIARCFRRVVHDFSPDVVLASWAYPDGWAAWQLARPRNLPVVIKVHGTDIHSVNSFAGRVEPTCACVRAADAIVAVSQHLKDSLTDMGVAPDRVHVVYNGVDEGRFFPDDQWKSRQKLGLSQRDPIVLFVGNLVPVKQVHVLLEAMDRLRRSGSSCRCYIVGAGPLRKTLVQRAQTLGLSNHVVFMGSRPHSELADWYRSADVVALPSRAEGVPNVLLEAMACGVPFVASKVGGIPEIADQPGCKLVAPGNSAAFADAIDAVLRSKARPEFRRSIESSAAKLAEALAIATRNFRLHTTSPGA